MQLQDIRRIQTRSYICSGGHMGATKVLVVFMEVVHETSTAPRSPRKTLGIYGEALELCHRKKQAILTYCSSCSGERRHIGTHTPRFSVMSEGGSPLFGYIGPHPGFITGEETALRRVYHPIRFLNVMRITRARQLV